MIATNPYEGSEVTVVFRDSAGFFEGVNSPYVDPAMALRLFRTARAATAEEKARYDKALSGAHEWNYTERICDKCGITMAAYKKKPSDCKHKETDHGKA